MTCAFDESYRLLSSCFWQIKGRAKHCLLKASYVCSCLSKLEKIAYICGQMGFLIQSPRTEVIGSSYLQSSSSHQQARTTKLLEWGRHNVHFHMVAHSQQERERSQAMQVHFLMSNSPIIYSSSCGKNMKSYINQCSFTGAKHHHGSMFWFNNKQCIASQFFYCWK